MLEKPRQCSAATTWGSENASGTCRTHSRPGSGAAPTAAPPSPPGRVPGLTSSGGSVNLLALQGACEQLAGEEGGREAARRGRLHLMERSGVLDLGARCLRRAGRAAEPSGGPLPRREPMRPQRRAGHRVCRHGLWRWRPSRDSGNPATRKTARILVRRTSRLHVSVAPTVQAGVPHQQVASSPALLPACSPGGRVQQPPTTSPHPSTRPRPSLPSAASSEPPHPAGKAHRERELAPDSAARWTRSFRRPSPTSLAAALPPEFYAIRDKNGGRAFWAGWGRTAVQHPEHGVQTDLADPGPSPLSSDLPLGLVQCL